jgi:polar amino acid transport system substrate-binding protein
VGYALTHGQADAVCNVLPEWIDGDFRWSVPLVPNAGVIVARPEAPVVHALADLADKPLSTVLGYRYPDLEPVLGAHFLRQDSMSVEHQFLKIGLGRIEYAVVERLALQNALRANKALKLRTDLVYSTFKAQCAFSRASQIPFGDIERAIAVLLRDGRIDAILARYR